MIRYHSLFMPGGGLARMGGWGHANFRTVRGGIIRKLAYKEGAGGGGGLSDFTILFYFKEMCSLLSAVLNGT